ncbi:hypothetical protein CW745_06985 [Psychromonas sp. psych-6C06]|uniref:hypothetical protein n=1 Tax=Psychromonas sp. psych-6C06 TaxID=2058089 RepID=UPI000C3264CC|nr:hypothetical protein [Psychromonas sp. psych-6C06]PKF62300.1 hypothetical protein CW745_06985 [Psychromonas sp. psych-6C06]
MSVQTSAIQNTVTRSRLSLSSCLKVIAYTIIVIGILYRVDYIIQFNPIHQIWSDPARHWEQGIDTLRFDPMSQTDPIGFQLYIATLAKLTLKIPALVAFYTSILAVITPWIWYRFMRELQPSKNAALLGWALLSITPSWISIYGYLMQETLFLPLLGAALFATWRCKRKQTLATYIVMIVVWMMAGLTRGVAIPLAMVACSWLWLIQGDKAPKALLGLVVLTFVLAPLAYRSYQIMHIFAPHGIGHMNMIYAKSGARSIEIQYHREGARWGYIFQSPAAEAKPFAPLSEWQSQREGRVYAYVDIDKGMVDWDNELGKQKLTLERYLWLTRDNLILLFFSESWPDSNRGRFIGEVNYQTRWIWFFMGLACCIAFVVKRKQQRKYLLLPALIVTWFVVQGLLPISVNEGRYRMPFNGLIIAQMVLLIGMRKNPVIAPQKQAL